MDADTFIKIEHGVDGYRYHDCRCEVCVESMRANWRGWNETYRRKKGSHRAERFAVHDNKIDTILEILHGS